MKAGENESLSGTKIKGKYAVWQKGVVATAFPNATEAGLTILRKGGNAVDAACAAAFALGVCEPQASGLGGQTMMLIYNGEKVIAIDGSSRAPSLAYVNAIYKEDRGVGYRATTVPSTPATLYYVQQRYGKLPWKQILQPAIHIAREGYRITYLQNSLQKRELKNFKKVESESGSRYFLKENKPIPEGELFCQSDLAKLLETLAEKGVEEFYIGKIAKQIDTDMRENGGLLRYDDLALIPWPIERRPLRRRFRKYRIYTMPPPGAGRTLLFSLLMIDAIPSRLFAKDEFRRIHLLASVFRKALLERADRPFDPNFYPQVSEKDMLNRIFAHQCIREIVKKVDKTILPSLATEDERSGETTHLSVMDGNGMAVSLTQSIERVYGSKAAAAGLGFLYNNYLIDFDYDIPEHPFYLRPNAVPWATVAPTLIFNKEDIWMALGSPGSERIFSTLAQFLLYIIDEKMDLNEAMRAPRVHCSLGGRVSLEAERFSPDLIKFLKEKGYRIDRREPYSFYLGAVHAVMRRENGSGFEGVAEIRRDGTASGI
jgi:gamma-glutamyltranspeptidase/glutathione hydrolase